MNQHSSTTVTSCGKRRRAWAHPYSVLDQREVEHSAALSNYAIRKMSSKRTDSPISMSLYQIMKILEAMILRCKTGSRMASHQALTEISRSTCRVRLT